MTETSKPAAAAKPKAAAKKAAAAKAEAPAVAPDAPAETKEHAGLPVNPRLPGGRVPRPSRR